MSAHIHTYTYIYTRIQNVHMNARKARLKRRRGSDCAGSPTWHQEALPFSLSASRQCTVQTTSAYLPRDWCGADPPSSLSTPAPSLAMPAMVPRNEVIFLPFWRCFFKSNLKKKKRRTEWLRLLPSCQHFHRATKGRVKPGCDGAWVSREQLRRSQGPPTHPRKRKIRTFNGCSQSFPSSARSPDARVGAIRPSFSTVCRAYSDHQSYMISNI